MSDIVHFEGDPETDSARRHLERVLQGKPPSRRWPWLLAALGGGGLWLVYRSGRDAAARTKDGAGTAADTKAKP